MKLIVLGSSSKGNGYILTNGGESLLLEAGVPFKKVLEHIDPSTIKGCIVTHEHLDHSEYIKEYRDNGIEVLAPYEEKEEHEDIDVFETGGFNIMFFECNHNVKCIGYVIEHEEIGSLVFATDTGYIKYKFNEINHWLIECNHSRELIDKSYQEGIVNHYLASRIVKDHMSLETLKTFFERNDLSNTYNIILCHLSEHNADGDLFKKEIQELTKKDVEVAVKGLEIDLSIAPY